MNYYSSAMVTKLTCDQSRTWQSSWHFNQFDARLMLKIDLEVKSFAIPTVFPIEFLEVFKDLKYVVWWNEELVEEDDPLRLKMKQRYWFLIYDELPILSMLLLNILNCAAMTFLHLMI